MLCTFTERERGGKAYTEEEKTRNNEKKIMKNELGNLNQYVWLGFYFQVSVFLPCDIHFPCFTILLLNYFYIIYEVDVGCFLILTYIVMSVVID